MKNTKLFITILIVALIIVGAFFVFSPKQEEQRVVKIGYSKFSFSIPLFVAMENGYFQDEGVEIELVNIEDNPSLLNAIISKQIDVASAIGSPVVFSAYNQDKESFKMIHSNFDTPEIPVGFLIVKSDSDITSLEDLANKKIGVLPANTASQVTIKELLKAKNIAEKDIVLVDIAPQTQPQALEVGSIDAVYAFDPTATVTLENFDTRILHTLDRTEIFGVNPYYGGSLIISTKFAQDKPEIANKVIRALDKAVNFVNNNDVESKLILSKYTPLDEEIAPKLRGKFFFLNPKDIDEMTLQIQADLFFEKGIIKDRVDIKGIVFKE